MKLANERVVGRSVPVTKDLDSVLTRLDRLSMTAGFATQRRIAFGRALQVYVELGTQAPLSPLPEEIQLADLLLYADFYPEDGQLTLIEQLRDVITEHIPEEERVWLDPLKHSYMDLVELLPQESGMARQLVRSIGNGRLYEVPAESLGPDEQAGEVLFTRLVREPGDPKALWPWSRGQYWCCRRRMPGRCMKPRLKSVVRWKWRVDPSNSAIGRSSPNGLGICC